MLRRAGMRANVALSWQGEKCDALIALHARRSHESILQFRRQKPHGALIVVLTGTDLYQDLPESKAAQRSLELADRVIVLQDAALRELSAATRRKARVVYQSTACALRHAPPKFKFRIAVVGHLRQVKDPFRTAAAIALLPGREEIETIHLGAALDSGMSEEAGRWMTRDRRYQWLGSVPHSRALGLIARSHLLIVSSVMEGGANVIAEAARIGTPVLASRVSGNVGMLGANYPGYFPLHNDAALANLIEKAMSDKSFYKKLSTALKQRRPLFSPAEERRALLGVVRESLRITS